MYYQNTLIKNDPGTCLPFCFYTFQTFGNPFVENQKMGTGNDEDPFNQVLMILDMR